MTHILVILADGCEELEAVTVIDLLRRASLNVVVASLSEDKHVIGSRGTHLIADSTLGACINHIFDMVVLPGGQPGTTHLQQDERVSSLIKASDARGDFVAAICAAPSVLAQAGLLANREATYYPGTLSQEAWPHIKHSQAAVVIDGNIITSRGPGTAIDFALTLIEVVTDHDTKIQVEAGLVREQIS
jgi:4-methyl-5(b-hydroxyethyl)-thiazole monophosphate biosynthesis